MPDQWARASFTVNPQAPNNHTISNLITGLRNFLTHASCGWELAPGGYSVTTAGAENLYLLHTDRGTRDIWKYTGDVDNPPTGKNCGLQIKRISATQLRIGCYLENAAGTGVERSGVDNTGALAYMNVTFDAAQPNNVFVIGGEHGLYLQSGKDGNPSNLGLGIVITFLEVPEYRPVFGNTGRKWWTQGLTLDLNTILNGFTGIGGTAGTPIGMIDPTFSTSRYFRNGLNYLTVRGSTSDVTPTPSNDQVMGIGNEMMFMSAMGTDNSTTVLSNLNELGRARHCLGIPFSLYNGKYALSQLMVEHAIGRVYQQSSVHRYDSGGTDSTQTSSRVVDYREWRKCKRFYATAPHLQPWLTIQDEITSLFYWVAYYPDQNGHGGNIAVEYPSSVVTVTI